MNETCNETDMQVILFVTNHSLNALCWGQKPSAVVRTSF